MLTHALFCYDPVMAFVRWDPLGDLLALQRRLDRSAAAQPGWAPPVDFVETADGYALTVEVPGLRRDDIQLHVHEGRLILEGRRPGRATGHEQYHRIERGRGTFGRTFQLPHGVDADRVTADLRDGVLTIHLPRAGVAGAQRVQVS